MTECGHPSKSDQPMKTAMTTLESIKNIGIKPRDHDDPQHDDDSKYSYDFNNVNFSINGIKRFTAHNGTTELAMDCLLYVNYILIFNNITYRYAHHNVRIQ